MANIGAVRGAGRILAVVVLATTVFGTAGAIAQAPAHDSATYVEAAPSRADQVERTGAWASHGYTLDLHADGTGDFSLWQGAFDGTSMRIALIPAPGPATVAEVTAIEQHGNGALEPHEEPGVGGLVTIAFGQANTAHVEWTSGPRRFAAELCPDAALDARQMAALGCGA